jgi:RNA polymerase sigma-70 factor (ECF subfamily)
MQAIPWESIAAHRERLLRLARRRCATPDDAEDVVQEALIRCATFEGLDEERLGPFLTSVTVRLCADSYRAAEQATRAVRRLACDDDVVPSPEDAVCDAAGEAALATLLARLPEQQRAVLVDRARGISLPDICRRRAMTYKAAESALGRARVAMRLALKSGVAALTGAALRLPRARRTAVVVAAPAAVAVLLAGPATRGPHAERPEPFVRAPRAVAPAAGATPTVPRPRPAAVSTPPRTEPARRAPNAFDMTAVFERDAGPVRLKDTRNQDEVTFLRSCVEDGVWLRVPTDGGRVYQGCGSERPKPDPGAVDVGTGGLPPREGSS